MSLLLKGKEAKNTFECAHLIENQRIMIIVSVFAKPALKGWTDVTDVHQSAQYKNNNGSMKRLTIDLTVTK